MWKREEPLRPGVPANTAQTPSHPSVVSDGVDQTREEQRLMHEERASIGTSIVINGELSGSEDLTIEGRVEGKIELRDHVLTVGIERAHQGASHRQVHRRVGARDGLI
jgi:hypothetical protein